MHIYSFGFWRCSSFGSTVPVTNIFTLLNVSTFVPMLNKFLYYHTHILEKLGFSSAVSKAPGSADPQPWELPWSCPRCGARLGFASARLGEAEQSRISPSSGRTTVTNQEHQRLQLQHCKHTPSSLLEKVMWKKYFLRKSRNCIYLRKCTLHIEPNFGQLAHHRSMVWGFN